MPEYEVFEPLDDTPLDVAYARMFSSGFYRCPQPSYGMEVSKDDESLHPYCYGDLVPARAG